MVPWISHTPNFRSKMDLLTPLKDSRFRTFSRHSPTDCVCITLMSQVDTALCMETKHFPRSFCIILGDRPFTQTNTNPNSTFDANTDWNTDFACNIARRQGWITSAHVRYHMPTKQNFRRELDLWFVSRFKKTHCHQQWSKGVLFLHNTSTVLAFASRTIIWIRTSWILIFWERSLGWNMNYDLLCLRISSVATQAFSQVFVIK